MPRTSEIKIPEISSMRFVTEYGIISLTKRNNEIIISSCAPADAFIPRDVEEDLKRRFVLLGGINERTPAKEPDKQPMLFPL